MTVLRVAVFLAGAALVVATALSALRTFVVPRAVPAVMTRTVFLISRTLFMAVARRRASWRDRDKVLVFYAPLTLLCLPAVWLSVALGAYTLMFWAVDQQSWRLAFERSGSSLLTLGFAAPAGVASTWLALTAATLGLGFVALLITYLPTMYSAFSRREAAVGLLEARADTPPSAVAMIRRFHLVEGLDSLGELWTSWETWFVDVEESHTSIAAIALFRSPQPEHSWVTAAGAVLDAAALTASTLDRPRAPRAELCIRAGFIALRRIADVFGIRYDADPRPTDPISVTREEFDDAYDHLARAGVPLKPDRDQAWRDFAGWRVNYDDVLLRLAALVVAPPAPWSSDRMPDRYKPNSV